MYPSKERKSIILTPSNYCNALNQPQHFLKRLRKTIYICENDLFLSEPCCWGNYHNHSTRKNIMILEKILRYHQFVRKNWFNELISSYLLKIEKKQCIRIFKIPFLQYLDKRCLTFFEFIPNKKEGLLSKSEKKIILLL